MTRLLIPTLLSLVCAASPVLAQTPSAIPPGTEVLVTSPTADGGIALSYAIRF